MKILLLTNLMEMGGNQKALLQLARGLQQRGHEIRVVTLFEKSDSITYFEEKYGIPILDLGVKRRHRGGDRSYVTPWSALAGLTRLFCIMRRGRFDVLQTFLYYSNSLGQLLGMLAGIPIRVSSQRTRLDWKPPAARPLERIVANSPTIQRMVCVSPSIRRYCVETLGIRASKLVVVENGIAVPPPPSPAALARVRGELRLSGRDFVVTMVARMHPVKDHDCLLRAVAGVADRMAGLRVLLVGHGPLRSKVEARIKALSLASIVKMTGERSDIPAILGISDLFVLTSRSEGMPNAVLEAMAAGLPVLATRVDGVVDVVRDNETGLLVPAGDDHALGSALQSLVGDPAHRRALGAAGRQVAATYTIDRFVQGFEQVYLSLDRARPRAARRR